MSDGEPLDTFIEDIAPDVMGVLENLQFFDKLDDHFCPPEDPDRRVDCKTESFEISTRILRDLGIDAEDFRGALQVLHSRGACCDCEILYNVAKESRLKTLYGNPAMLKRRPGTTRIAKRYRVVTANADLSFSGWITHVVSAYCVVACRRPV